MPTKEDLLLALSDAIKAQDDAIRGLIVMELEAQYAALERKEEQAAARLATAIGDLRIPEEMLQETEAAIAVALNEVNAYTSEINSDSNASPEIIVARVTGRAMIDEWTAELDKLRAKKRDQESGMSAFRDERELAKQALRQIQEELRLLKTNMDYPFLFKGQDTAPYKAFRAGGYEHHRILENDAREHPEYDAAKTAWLEEAQASGLRTDNLAQELRQRAVTESVRNQQALFPNAGSTGAPAGGDVRTGMLGSMQATQEAKTVNHIERRR
jgi:hypothetical protein